MKTAGLIGGIAPESTIDYYRRILDAWRQHDSSSSPSLVIDSLDVQRGLRLVASDGAAFTEYPELRLLLPGADIAGVPVLDTTALHVGAIVERLRHDHGRSA